MITRIIDGFKELWRGEQPLGRAFWVYFVMWWIGIFFLSFFVAAFFALIGLRPLVPVIGAMSVLGYPLFAGIGVWRSANAYELHGFYPFLAKVAVLVVLLPMFWRVFNGGFENFVLAFMG